MSILQYRIPTRTEKKRTYSNKSLEFYCKTMPFYQLNKYKFSLK